MDKQRFSLFAILFLLAASVVWFYFQRQSAAPVQHDAIIFGAQLELSGKFSHNGAVSAEGIQLALQDINSSGGLLGRPVQLVSVDNRSDEKVSAEAFVELSHTANLAGVIGPIYSNLAISVAPKANASRIPFIATGATNPRVTVDDSGRVHPYVFRVCYIDPFQGRVMASFALQSLKAKSAALFIDETAAYSKGLSSFFEQAFLQKGGLITGKAAYTPSNDDFRPALKSLLANRPDVLFLPGFYSEAAKIIVQARELGFSGPILGGDGWDEALLTRLAPAQALDNTFYCGHYYHSDSSPRLNAFAARYAALSNNKELTTPAILSYDATLLLADAVRRAGSIDPQKVRTALEQTKDFPSLLGAIRFDKHHNPEKDAFVVEIVNGKGHFRQRISPLP